jgi:uncharacterized protein with gpF-like domain
MTIKRIDKLKYARKVLLAQDKISTKYFRKIKAELTIVGDALAKSYLDNGNDDKFQGIGQDHEKRLVIILTELSRVTNQTFRSIGIISIKSVFDTLDTSIESQILGVLAANVLTTSAEIADTTIASASAVIIQQMQISQNIAPDKYIPSISRMIAKKIGGNNAKSRAMTIARTETHKAANVSQFTRAEMAATDSGLDVQIEWISTNDGRVRDSHRSTNGQIVAIGEKFNVGGTKMKYPSDPSGGAANVINCRCVLGYHVPEE